MSSLRRSFLILSVLTWLSFACCFPNQRCAAEELVSKAEAQKALQQAVEFFRENCSAGGGYIFRVSVDLTKREGEGVVGKTTAWLEPPATPAVGMAYLEAYQLSGDELCLKAAIETAEALLQGQLESGGWYHKIEFDPNDRQRYAFRVEKDSAARRANTTTFDDDKSQSAARFLMQLDRELKFKTERLHEATLFALNCFVKSQYPNGAWPQRYSEFPQAKDFLVKAASFPKQWSRQYKGEDYKKHYTLNDDTISDLIVTMLDAYEVYGDEKFQESAKRGGDFLILAQLPQPQPGWAQQYNKEMHPAWARKFEPAAITGGESQGVMRTLLHLYRRTGDRKYLEPIPRALAYYRSVQLSDNKMARFYEIRTNRPLYFTKDYKLTYSDADMPTHYGFKVGHNLDRIQRDLSEIERIPKNELWKPRTVEAPRSSRGLQRRATELVRSLDKRGAWVEDGSMKYHENDDTKRIIQSSTFAKNLVALASFIGSKD
jgi:PelA/Pel-15E family pectate lyase